jgi:hypothetical protein
MRTITNTESIKLTVDKGNLLEGKYLPLTVLSNKLREIEKGSNLGYKQLRNRMYNSKNCNKYNMKEIAGITCIDVTNPMQGKASLDLTFEVA